MLPPILGVLAAAVLLAACSGSGGDGASRGVVETDSAGVRLVQSPAGPRYLAPTHEVQFALGGGEEPHDAFYRAGPWNVAVDSRGRIHVLDLDAHQLHLFDGDGTHLRTVGSRGEGPGELQFPAGLAVDPEGRAWVVDLGRRGFVRFGHAGEILPQEALPEAFAGGVTRWIETGLVLTTRNPEGATRLILDPREGTPPMVLDSLPPGEQRAIQLSSCGVGFSGMSPLFAPSLVWAAAGDWVVVNRGSEYVLDVYEGGRLVRSLRREMAPRPATREMALASLGEGMQVLVNGRPLTCDPEEVVEQRGLAPTLPMFERLGVGPDGSVWAERYEVGDERGVVDHFGPDGHYRGSFPPGSPVPLEHLPDGRALWTETDDLGVGRVVVGWTG